MIVRGAQGCLGSVTSARPRRACPTQQRGAKLFFVSFADGNKFIQSQAKQAQTALALGIDVVVLWNRSLLLQETNYPQFQADGWSRLERSGALRTSTWGMEVDREDRADWWRWKPFIIMYQLQCIRDGDVVFYADASAYFTQGITYPSACGAVKWIDDPRTHGVFPGFQLKDMHTCWLGDELMPNAHHLNRWHFTRENAEAMIDPTSLSDALLHRLCLHNLAIQATNVIFRRSAVAMQVAFEWWAHASATPGIFNGSFGADQGVLGVLASQHDLYSLCTGTQSSKALKNPNLMLELLALQTSLTGSAVGTSNIICNSTRGGAVTFKSSIQPERVVLPASSLAMMNHG